MYVIYIIVITIIFIVYTEITVGNILFRINSSGRTSINIKSMLSFMVHPLHNRFLWYALDINYPFILILSSFLYFIKKLIPNVINQYKIE